MLKESTCAEFLSSGRFRPIGKRAKRFTCASPSSERRIGPLRSSKANGPRRSGRARKRQNYRATSAKQNPDRRTQQTGFFVLQYRFNRRGAKLKSDTDQNISRAEKRDAGPAGIHRHMFRLRRAECHIGSVGRRQRPISKPRGVTSGARGPVNGRTRFPHRWPLDGGQGNRRTLRLRGGRAALGGGR
jgi:hypothetical protein